MKLKKFSLVLSLIMLASFTLLSCTKKNSEESDENLTEMNVLLDWYPNAVHSFLYAAEEQGYFKEAGLKVNLITPSGTEDGIKLVATNKADLAISYPKQVILSRGEDIPIKSVGAIVRSSLNQLMVRKDSGIKTLKDLEGKKIGFPSFEIDKETIKEMVKKAGGDPSKIDFIDVGYDLMSSMQTKRVDGIIGGYINHEKILLEKEGIEISTFNPVDFDVPNNYELVFIASDEGLSKNKDKIEAFLKATKKGYDYMVSNPSKALDLVLKVQNESFPLESDVEKQSLDILMPLMEDKTGTFLTQDEENWKNNIKWLEDKDLLKGTVNPKDVYEEIIK